MTQDEAFEVFNDYVESGMDVPEDLFMQITGVPIWWDSVGSEWAKARRKLIRWAEKVSA